MNGIPVWIEDERNRSLKIGDLSSEIWDLWGFWRFVWSFEARKRRREETTDGKEKKTPTGLEMGELFYWRIALQGIATGNVINNENAPLRKGDVGAVHFG
ncbi:hypothetical protein AAC387_Pa02g3408 [Persea americana]